MRLGAHRQGRKWSKGPPAGLEVVGGHPAGPEVVGRLSGMAVRGQEALRQGRKWSGGPPAGLEVIVEPSGNAGSGQRGPLVMPEVIEGALLQGRKWSGGFPAGQKVVGGSQARLEVFEGRLTRPEVIMGPSRNAGSGRGSLR